MSDRARFRYDNDLDPSPVQLPAGYDATPAIIRPGDVTEVNAEAAELLDDDDHFSRVGDDVAIADSSPLAGATTAELQDYLDSVGVAYPANARKAALEELARAYAATHPIPPGAPPAGLAPLDAAAVAGDEAETTDDADVQEPQA